MKPYPPSGFHIGQRVRLRNGWTGVVVDADSAEVKRAIGRNWTDFREQGDGDGYPQRLFVRVDQPIVDRDPDEFTHPRTGKIEPYTTVDVTQAAPDARANPSKSKKYEWTGAVTPRERKAMEIIAKVIERYVEVNGRADVGRVEEMSYDVFQALHDHQIVSK